MLEALAKNWWLMVLRGLLALLLGIAILIFPKIAAASLVIFIGIYALVDGVFALVMAIVNRPRHRDRWWLLFEGIIGILAGILILASPLMAEILLIFFVAFWAIFTGIFEIIFAIAQWKTFPDKWLVLLGGIFSLMLGVLILSNLAFGLVLIITMIAVYLVLFGVLLISLGISLRSTGKALPGGAV
ncbi:MAG: DUF308 domain-containing protein [Dehalococcoidia bacterium]|nr:DUF308 domain-containing protein [Dehalococcoidia bacterium]